MKKVSRRNAEIRQNFFSFLLVLFILSVIPPTVFFLSQEKKFDILAAQEKSRELEYLESENPPDFIPGEVLVTFKEEPNIGKGFDFKNFEVKKKTKHPSVNKILKKYEIENITKIKDKVYKISLPAKQLPPSIKQSDYTLPEEEQVLLDVVEGDVFQIAEEFRSDPNVEGAGPNYIVTALETQGDPEFDKQWNLNSISAPAAWEINRGDSGVVIAIIDTGIDKNHPDLKDKLTLGYDFVNNDADPDDDNGHGTHVAGIAAASTFNGIGIAGVCPNCSLMPIKVLASSGRGTIANVIKGIDFARERGVEVINMSLGCNCPDESFKKACDDAYNSGVVVVAAAGNTGKEGVHHPASFASVIGVASLDKDDKKASTSTYGGWVALSAPGNNVYSTFRGGGYRYLSGTSMASPHVAGVAGLVRSQSPNMSAAEVRERLNQSFDDIYDKNPSYIGKLGTGKINAYKALQAGVVLKAEIFTPESNSFVRDITEIVGRVQASENIATVYSLEYTKEGEKNWKTEGIELPHGGEYQTEKGFIGRWDTRKIEDVFYILRLTVKEKSNPTNQVSFTVRVMVANNLAWVVDVSFQPFSPTVGDVDGNGTLETVVANKKWVTLIEADGKAKVFPSYTSHIDTEPVLADLDKDGDLEILANANYYLYAWHHNGQTVNGWPQRTREEYVDSFLVADLENDGSLDIVAVAYNAAQAGGGDSNVYVWESSGQMKTGWPQHREAWPGNPAVGDLDNDGDLEIVSGSKHLTNTGSADIYVWHHDGTLLKGWPQKTERDVNAASIGDIDGDGDLEIVAGGGYVSNSVKNPVFAWNHDGTSVENWPVYTQTFTFDVSLADLDQDGKLEILVEDTHGGGGKLLVYDHKGRVLPGWPKVVPGEWGSFRTPIVADIDGNKTPDIIVGGSDGKIRAFKTSGEEIPLNLSIDSKWVFNLAVADIEGDGKMEVVATSGSNQVFAWNLESAYSPEASEWPMYRHDERHTAAYRLSVGPPPEKCPNAHPQWSEYYGRVHIDGNPAPSDLPIRLFSPRGELVGCGTTKIENDRSIYPFIRAWGGEPPDFKGMEDGEEVTFKVNKLMTLTEPAAVVWHDDHNRHEVNLYALSKPLPDLEVQEIKVTVHGEIRPPKPGEEAEITAIVINKGQADSGPFHYLWYINDDPEGHRESPSIPHGEVAKYTRGWIAESGAFTFKFEADSQQEVRESKEYNNTAQVSLEIPKLLPDLSVSNLKVTVNGEERFPNLEELFYIQATITNIGQSNAGTFYRRWDINGKPEPDKISEPLAIGRSATYSDGWKADRGGNFTYAFIADSKNGIEESNEGNNKAEVTFRIPGLRVIPPSVGLELVKDYQSISGLTMKEVLTITSYGATTWQLKNNNDASYKPPDEDWRSVPAQGFGFYESSGGISPGQNIKVRAYVNNNKPHGVYKGSYTLQEVEQGKAIDVQKIDYTLDVKEPPDLIAMDISITKDDKEEEPKEGDNVDVWAAIGNHGDLESGEFKYSWYIDGKIVAENISHSTLPSTIRKRSAQYAWNNVPAGEHTLKIILDTLSQVKEKNENNNSFEKKITVKARKADLEAAKIKLMQGDKEVEPIVGDPVVLHGEFENIGEKETGQFYVEWYKDGKKIDRYLSQNIPADGKVYVTQGYPWIVEKGNHNFEFKLDTDNQVAELNEGNNSYSLVIVPNERADLEVSDIKIFEPGTEKETEPEVGKLVTLFGVLKNIGGKDTGIFNVKWYKDGKQVWSGSHENLSPDPNKYSRGNVRYDWTVERGTHKFVFEADSDNKVVESNEKNNSYERTITVTPKYRLIVRAKGTSAWRNWPMMQIRVNGQYLKDNKGRVITTTVSTNSYKDYEFYAPGITSASEVDIAYINDLAGLREDRNLFIDHIELGGKRIEAGAHDVYYDLGLWNRAFDWEDVLLGQEEMSWNGALRFNAKGLGVLKVVARGDPYWKYGGLGYWWPRIQIRVDGKYFKERSGIKTVEVNTDTYKEYIFIISGLTSGSKIDIAFINDRSNTRTKQDVNLYINYIEASSKKIEAENSDVRYDIGSYLQAFDGKNVMLGQEAMYWNGALRFNQSEIPVKKIITFYK